MFKLFYALRRIFGSTSGMVRIFRSDKAGDPVTDIEDVRPSRNATYGRGPYGSGLYGSGARYG